MSSAEADEAVARRFFETLLADDLEGWRGCLAPDYEEVYPQSGERLASADAAVELIRRHPARPTAAGPLVLTRLGDGVVLAEVPTDEGGERYWVIALLEVLDGRIRRERVYFAAPFDVPPWRADFVERVDPADPALWVTDGSGREAARAAVEQYTAALMGDDPAAIAALLDPDWQVVYPQSGERHDIATERRIDENYPQGLPRRRVVDIRGGSDLWVMTPMNVPMLVSSGGRCWLAEGIFDYATGDRWHVAIVGFTKDGRLWRERHYWARPFEPGTWRADLVERIAIGGLTPPGTARPGG